MNRLAVVSLPLALPVPFFWVAAVVAGHLAVVSVLLAFLGPFFWVAAIVAGHLALRRLKRTGQSGATLVPVTLVFLYLFTVPVLLPTLALAAVALS